MYPLTLAFDYVEKLIDSQHPSIKRIYMVGDNPLTDIKGANDAGGRWRSILTRTGMHVDEENHEEHPAYQIVEDVSEALKFMQEDFQKHYS